MKKLIFAFMVLLAASSFAQTESTYNVVDSGTFVSLRDSTGKVFHTYAKNKLALSKTSGNRPDLTLTTTEGEFVAYWTTRNVYILAPTIDSGYAKINHIIYTPIASTSNTYVVDSGGTLVYVMDSNALLPLQQDTIGAGESKDYEPYSFGMSFENAVGSADVTINGVTYTYAASTGNLPYNPSHRQPITVDCSALTSGRIRFLYK